jgi:4-amino-4-deoxy-L-arabinose transferase-like glycosyltransferase
MQLNVNFSKNRHWLAAGILCVLVGILYLSTTAKDLTFAHQGTDGGDLAAAAWNLGVPHPPGYPTYTLLGWLFTRLPVGTIAFRTNIMSAVFGAGAIFFVFLAAWELQPQGDRSLVLPVATSGILAFSTLYWSQSVITEVYSLLGFFAACLLWLLVHWRGGAAGWHLYLAGFLLGLGLGNHLSLVFH